MAESPVPGAVGEQAAIELGLGEREEPLDKIVTMANRLIQRLMYLHEQGILHGEHGWWHEQEGEFHDLNIALTEYARLSVNEGGVAPYAGLRSALDRMLAAADTGTRLWMQQILDEEGGVAPVEPQEPR